MTKETFEKLEAICKKAWRELARSGNDSKPDYLDKYKCSCPACHIADASTSGYICRVCPIDKFRKQAFADRKEYRDYSTSACLADGQPYQIWWDNWDTTIEKTAAKEISELKWTFLAAHKKAEL